MGVECDISNKDIQKYYIWVDSKIKNSENSVYANYLSKQYDKISSFTNIKDAMKYLKKIKFKMTYIIVSGALFAEFISELKILENKITTVPKIIIFTSESTKYKIQNMKEINNSFYNIGGLAVTFEEVKSFLNQNIFGKELDFKRSLRREKIQTGGDFSFEIMENKNDIVGPVYLSDLIMKPHRLEFAPFDKYLIDNYGDEMNELISQIYNIDCPNSLRIKYWLRAYTLETQFYKDMNSDLMKGKTKLYLPYIKLMYSGLLDNVINSNISDDLYRGALINEEEIYNLINHKNQRKQYDIPSRLIYCKSFMSFSLEKDVALDFMWRKRPTDKEIRVLYILNGEPGLDHKNATNVDLNGITCFEDEREILLFPYSIYEINNIIKKDDYYEIYINYLGKYRDIFHYKNEIEFYNSICKSKFINLLDLAGLFMPIWLAKKSLCGISPNLNQWGSGFCCLIPLPNKKSKIPVLITCNHVLPENTLKNGNKIFIIYDDDKQTFDMNITHNSKIYTNREYDITIIGMEENNDITKQLIFMDIDEDIFNDINILREKFYNKRAYILAYIFENTKPRETNEFHEKSGYIRNKNLDEFTKDKTYSMEEGRMMIDESGAILHNIPTSLGSGGGPILSYKKFKVLGYHKGRLIESSKFSKIGGLLKFPIQEFIRKFYS